MERSLFDDVERDDLSPACYAEPRFTYLNRSARPEFICIRNVIDEWFSQYPDSERAELCGRFRDTNDLQHQSAFFELLLHEIFVRLGYSLTLHPDLQGTTRHPDFWVESVNWDSFYLEAVLATEDSKQNAAERARMNEVYDALNRLDSPNFFIGMNLKRFPTVPPPARKIRAFLENRITSLDPDTIARAVERDGVGASPRWLYEDQSWHIEFFPIPKSPDLQGKPGVRPVAMQFYGMSLSNTRVAIRDAIIGKAKRYGDLPYPYVIAVNMLSCFVEDIDIMEALFGQEQITINCISGEPENVTRSPNGVWYDESGVRYTRVSGVLIFSHAVPSNLQHASVRLYHNPWARKPLNPEAIAFPQAIPQGDQMQCREGQSLEETLGLPHGWPRV